MSQELLPSRYHGFTMIELIVVISILGILSVAAIARFSDRAVFETRGFADQTLATLQYARKVAVATGRNVCVTATSGGNTLTARLASARGGAVSCVAGTVVTNPSAQWRSYSGVTYGAALNSQFAGDGTASASASFTVLGDHTYTIVIETTGYIHCNPVSACE